MKRRLSQRLPVITCAIVWLALSGATLAANAAQPVRAGGLEIFYGVIPAEILLGHPGDHEERRMHGGTPTGRGQHHLIVSVFDAKTRERVADATVTARVGQTGLAIQEKILEPMQFGGTATYGNYFKMVSPGPYRIDLEIRRIDAVQRVKTVIRYSHPRR